MTKKTNITRSPVQQNEEPVRQVGADPFVCYIFPGLPPKNTPRIQFSVLKSHLRDEVVSKIPKKKQNLKMFQEKKYHPSYSFSLQKKKQATGILCWPKKIPASTRSRSTRPLMLCLGGSKKPLGRGWEGEAAEKSDVPRSQRGAPEMGGNPKKKTPLYF